MLLRLLALTVILAAGACSSREAAPEAATTGATPAAATPAPAGSSDSVCVGYRPCLVEEEPRALARRSDVRRDSLRLIFDVPGRAPVELENGNPAHEDSHYYLYNGWDSTLQAHRVYLMEYESSAILYVFPKSGAVSGLDALPHLSPTGRYLATAKWDTEAQMEPNRARVFRITPDSLVLEWEIEPKLWGPDSLRWIDDSTLVVTRGAAYHHPNPQSVATPVIVRRVRGTWRPDSAARAP